MAIENGCGLCNGTADVVAQAVNGYSVLPDGLDEDDVMFKFHSDDGTLSLRVLKWFDTLSDWRPIFEYFPVYCPYCGRRLRDPD